MEAESPPGVEGPSATSMIVHMFELILANRRFQSSESTVTMHAGEVPAVGGAGCIRASVALVPG